MCLWKAIEGLAEKEYGCYPVYSGLNGVKMDTKIITNAYFVTYVSTSWSKYIASRFMKKEGMMIHFDEAFKDPRHGGIICCDVSWISKFPDECEILFARSRYKGENNFACVVLDEVNGIQTVALKTTWDYDLPNSAPSIMRNLGDVADTK